MFARFVVSVLERIATGQVALPYNGANLEQIEDSPGRLFLMPGLRLQLDRANH
jgi:hypothetical protein